MAVAGAVLALGASQVLTGNVRTVAAARSVTTAGWDISWPQCPSNFPHGGAFAIVGVTNGRPWGANPCLSAEYSWAAALPSPPAFYMNTANPAPTSSFYWPSSGSSDPVLCRDATVTTDPGCAYDYGWHAAADAFTTASPYGAASHAWWLDVETGNTWNGNGYSNAADLQGSIDYLRSRGVSTVGVYSTQYQWKQITGGYTIASSSAYAASWSSEFTSPNGIGSSPDWVAGAGNASQAASFCSSAYSFTGAPVKLTQYPSGQYDADHRCP